MLLYILSALKSSFCHIPLFRVLPKVHAAVLVSNMAMKRGSRHQAFNIRCWCIKVIAAKKCARKIARRKNLSHLVLDLEPTKFKIRMFRIAWKISQAPLLQLGWKFSWQLNMIWNMTSSWNKNSWSPAPKKQHHLLNSNLSRAFFAFLSFL